MNKFYLMVVASVLFVQLDAFASNHDITPPDAICRTSASLKRRNLVDGVHGILVVASVTHAALAYSSGRDDVALNSVRAAGCFLGAYAMFRWGKHLALREQEQQ